MVFRLTISLKEYKKTYRGDWSINRSTSCPFSTVNTQVFLVYIEFLEKIVWSHNLFELKWKGLLARKLTEIFRGEQIYGNNGRLLYLALYHSRLPTTSLLMPLNRSHHVELILSRSNRVTQMIAQSMRYLTKIGCPESFLQYCKKFHWPFHLKDFVFKKMKRFHHALFVVGLLLPIVTCDNFLKVHGQVQIVQADSLTSKMLL